MGNSAVIPIREPLMERVKDQELEKKIIMSDNYKYIETMDNRIVDVVCKSIIKTYMAYSKLGMFTIYVFECDPYKVKNDRCRIVNTKTNHGSVFVMYYDYSFVFGYRIITNKIKKYLRQQNINITIKSENLMIDMSFSYKKSPMRVVAKILINL